jgi:uncharacterized RDD family membrane protein YckC
VWRRLGAGGLDIVFVFFLVGLVGGMGGGRISEESLRLLYNLIKTGLLFVLLWIYFPLFERYRGQTFGKILFKVRVVKIDQDEMRYDDAFVRNFSKTIAIPPLLLFFDWLLGLRKEGYLRYLEWYTKTAAIRELKKNYGGNSVFCHFLLFLFVLILFCCTLGPSFLFILLIWDFWY